MTVHLKQSISEVSVTWFWMHLCIVQQCTFSKIYRKHTHFLSRVVFKHESFPPICLAALICSHILCWPTASLIDSIAGHHHSCNCIKKVLTERSNEEELTQAASTAHSLDVQEQGSTRIPIIELCQWFRSASLAMWEDGLREHKYP